MAKGAAQKLVARTAPASSDSAASAVRSDRMDAEAPSPEKRYDQAVRRGAIRTAAGVAYQYGFQAVVGAVPRLAFGNDAGLRNNLAAARELRRFQRTAVRGEALDAVGQDARTLSEQGFLVFDAGLDPEHVRAVATAFHTRINDERFSAAIGPRVRNVARGIINPAQSIPQVPALLNPRVRRLIEAHYNAHFRVLSVRAWRNHHVPSAHARTDVYSNLWHNDHDPVTTLRYFVYLSDEVDETSGALHVLPRPDTRKAMRSGYVRRRAIFGPAKRIVDDPQRVRIVKGSIGTTILLNPQVCLHRAGVPSPGRHRDILQFNIGPSPAPLTDTWPAELPEDPDALR